MHSFLNKYLSNAITDIIYNKNNEDAIIKHNNKSAILKLTQYKESTYVFEITFLLKRFSPI